MAVEARYFLDGQAQSARFADFVPQEMKYVALIAACPSEDRRKSSGKEKRQTAKKRAQARKMQCFPFFGAAAPALNYDKLSRSK